MIILFGNIAKEFRERLLRPEEWRRVPHAEASLAYNHNYMKEQSLIILLTHKGHKLGRISKIDWEEVFLSKIHFW